MYTSCMTRYILHGGFTSVENENNASFYAEFTSNLPEGGTILLVYFSRRDEEIPKLTKQDTQAILKQSKLASVNIKVATRENFKQELEEANVVYMRGGETDKLYNELLKHPDFSKTIKGKTIIGSSAGAYVLAAYRYWHSEGGVQKGLSILPIRILCHYQSEVLPPHKDAMQELEKCPAELELVVLKDTEWRLIETD